MRRGETTSDWICVWQNSRESSLDSPPCFFVFFLVDISRMGLVRLWSRFASLHWCLPFCCSPHLSSSLQPSRGVRRGERCAVVGRRERSCCSAQKRLWLLCGAAGKLSELLGFHHYSPTRHVSFHYEITLDHNGTSRLTASEEQQLLLNMNMLQMYKFLPQTGMVRSCSYQCPLCWEAYNHIFMQLYDDLSINQAVGWGFRTD